MSKSVLSILILILALMLADRALAAAKAAETKTVAVMPFGTLPVGDVSVDMTRIMTDAMKKHEFNVISQDALEGFLIQRRIRRPDFLDRAAIRAMGSVLKVDGFVTGSVDLIADGENPMVSMNAQMIDCVEGSVIWANSFSCTGADYATFLGLGKITSLRELVDIAVDELLKDLPAYLPDTLPGTGSLDSSSQSPFEIVRASFSPEVLRGGDSARLSIEVGEITGAVQSIRAFVLDNEIKLTRQDGKYYSGTVTAPTVEGIYPLKIYVTDRWNRLFGVDAMASLTVHNSPPEIAVLFRQRLISPNNDGVNDKVLFFPEVLKANILQAWEVEITNGDGEVVRSENGIGVLPESFVWRGDNDQHKTVEDGTYFCQLFVEDKAGNRTSTKKEKIVVDTTRPEVTVSVAEANQEGITLALKANDMSQIDYWELIIYDTAGAEAARFGGRGDIPATLTSVVRETQNGLKQEGESLLAYSLEVRDVAGNRLQVEKEPLRPPQPEGIEATPEEKPEVWIEDF